MSKIIAIMTFTGKSGNEYAFNTYDKNTTFNEVSAVYVFVKRYTSGDQHYQQALYIGETNELGTRISNHETWPCVNKKGCTHIGIMLMPEQEDRLDAETDLRDKYRTPCNDC